MNDNLKQFSADLAANLKSALQSQNTAEFIEKTKASGDDRTFEVVMSTSDEDRQGDSLDQSGWDLKYFDMNPVLLWAHNYQSFPIGIITDIKIEGDKAVATGKFAPAGLNPEADLACSLYQEKILRAVSPGYIQNDDGSRELLEVSFCPVPAGRYALSLRQTRALGLSTRELIAKGFFYKKTESPPTLKTDDPVLGDPCELDDGTPGVLAEDPKNPKRLVCVPPESKSNETQENMNDELTKALKAEHGRHRGEVSEHVSDLADVAATEEKAENDGLEKAIEEFTEKMDGEQETHLKKCMKAVDDAYKIDPEEKSIDEFKKAIEGEHLKHVKAFHKAIEEFGKAQDGEVQKAIEEFKSASDEELDRHEQAHEDMCKAEFGEGQDDGKTQKKLKGAVADTLEQSAEYRAKNERINYIFAIIYAFANAYDQSPVESFSELIGEAIDLIEAYVSEEAKDDDDFEEKTVQGLVAASLKKVSKSGRAISAKNKAKIDSIIKAIEEFHSEHTADHEEFTNKAIAALKELGSPQGNEGKDDEEDDSRTPKSRSATSGAKTDSSESLTELDAYLLTQRLARKIKSEAESILRQVKKPLKELRS